MKISQAQKLLISSGSADDFQANALFVHSLYSSGDAPKAMKILTRIGAANKLNAINEKVSDLPISQSYSSSLVANVDGEETPIVFLPLDYYMDRYLGLEGAKFYSVYFALLDCPEVICTLAIYDSVFGSNLNK